MKRKEIADKAMRSFFYCKSYLQANTSRSVAFSVLVFSILWIIFGPALLTKNSSHFDFRNTGQIGDTIGGITAPVIGLVSAVLLYLSFTAQIQANKLTQQEANFKYILDEFEKVKSKINGFQYYTTSMGKFSGYPAIERLARDVLTHFNLYINEWQYDNDLKKLDYLMKNFSIFINEVYTLDLSLNQRKVIQSKIWLYYSENMEEHFQAILLWHVEAPTKDQLAKFHKSYEFQFLIRDIVFYISEFKGSLSS